MSVCVMGDIAGTTLTEEDITFLLQPEIAGIILFSRNYESPEQLRDLCASVKKVREDLLIAVDQEGGRVQRFRNGFLRLPAMAALGQIHSDSAEQSLSKAESLGWLMAAELIHYGVDISFAPVLDLSYREEGVIGDRAFSESPEAVTELTRAFVNGMSAAGMQATAKHFPGHGYVTGDSHHELPVDDRPLSEIENKDLIPFRSLISEEKLSAVMPAHIVYSAVDNSSTAGFSSWWLQEYLRKALGFGGLIYSDDLSMEGAAASGSPAVRAEKAKNAGCNVLLICNNREAAQEITDAVRSNGWSLISLADMKADKGNLPENLFMSEVWKQHAENAGALISGEHA